MSTIFEKYGKRRCDPDSHDTRTRRRRNFVFLKSDDSMDDDDDIDENYDKNDDDCENNVCFWQRMSAAAFWEEVKRQA